MAAKPWEQVPPWLSPAASADRWSGRQMLFNRGPCYSRNRKRPESKDGDVGLERWLHEDLHLDPRNPHKKLGVTPICNSSVG